MQVHQDIRKEGELRRQQSSWAFLSHQRRSERQLAMQNGEQSAVAWLVEILQGFQDWVESHGQDPAKLAIKPIKTMKPRKSPHVFAVRPECIPQDK